MVIAMLLPGMKPCCESSSKLRMPESWHSTYRASTFPIVLPSASGLKRAAGIVTPTSLGIRTRR
eukprot:5295223-Amphidinium_carterae.1